MKKDKLLSLLRLLGFDRRGDAKFRGILAMQTNIKVKVIAKDGRVRQVSEYYDCSLLEKLWHKFRKSTVLNLGSGLVTHAGVRLLSQDTAVTAGAATFSTLKFHGTGTGTTAATATDTALQTAIGTTASSGTLANADASPNATITTVGTINYSGVNAVTEWGLFNQSTLSGATMWDHKVFSAVNVVSGDTFQVTYVLTLNSGG